MLDRAKKTPLLGTVNEQWGWEIKITCDYLIFMDKYIVFFRISYSLDMKNIELKMYAKLGFSKFLTL